jgi:hypothetical protein
MGNTSSLVDTKPLAQKIDNYHNMVEDVFNRSETACDVRLPSTTTYHLTKRTFQKMGIFRYWDVRGAMITD